MTRSEPTYGSCSVCGAYGPIGTLVDVLTLTIVAVECCEPCAGSIADALTAMAADALAAVNGALLN